ncbi:glycosyltransferase family 4 protein [Bacillus thuringiensis]|uniref:glycosyltransferase family 4 protein n=1 Tax=Bacillus cereus group TaxID=86661 RepID=UPI0018CCA14E|nr:glycosyltransferase [Bacillus thuringiensis]MEB9335611.1 glycosyltransferase [Bacillus cereus]HEF1856261.1 glycosyltransferase [Bacillus cereus]HEF1868645.1 glycosyltransferase [Bacillus cereus]HEF1879149.1 glycosyltransferase [Bacillus cereus]HEF1885192.1 glycosyltransferase [Bacillus cereus]
MKDILILAPYYLPGFKGGGPIRSISNLVHTLGNEINFKIITSDRDLGDSIAYEKAQNEVWTKVGLAEVYYVTPEKFNLRYLRKIIKSTHYDFIYLNSFFNTNFSVIPILLSRMGIIPYKPIIVAPRGEFSPGALKIKKFKKELFIKSTKLVGLHNKVIWHATSEEEKTDITQIYGEGVPVRVAQNLPNIFENTEYQKKEKKRGELKLVFLSRITEKKNLKGALTFLKGITGNITFDIYGPIENQNYWKTCQDVIESLPNNVQVNYMGQVNNNKVHLLFSNYNAFLFPTFGENYGHVIVESLLAGCPVIISDQTPWKNIENEGAGWTIPLEKEETFISALNDIVHMDSERFQQLSRNASEYAVKMFFCEEILKQNRDLFSIN